MKSSLASVQIHSLAIACIASLLIAATPASAEILTLAFESGVGFYDPDHPMDGLHGPYDWIENGARYSGWWLNDVGTPAGADEVGHTHLVGENDSVYPLIGDQQHAWRDDLQGTTVSFDEGYEFDVVSIDVRILSRDSPPFDAYNMQRLPWSFDLDDAQLLLTDTASDPVAPDFATFESQFTAFPIDDGSVWDNGDGTFDPNRPATETFHTIQITGFEDITRLDIAHSAGLVWIDNIVVDVDTSTGVPEPGQLPMLVAGALFLVLTARASRPPARA